MGKNILDEYIDRNKQIIILILGLPCSNKSTIAKQLSKDTKLITININDYQKKSFIEEKVGDLMLKMYEHPKNYDWDKLNEIVNEHKTKGIILYGSYIDVNKINFTINYSFFINMNNTLCKKKIFDYELSPYDKNNTLDNSKIDTYLTNFLYPLYEKLKSDIKINKYFNIKENTTIESIYDVLWDVLITLIQSSLKNKNQ